MKRVTRNAIVCLVGAAGLAHAQTAQLITVGETPGGFDFSQVWGVTRDGSTVIGITNGEHDSVVGDYIFRATVGQPAQIIPELSSRDVRGVSGDAGLLCGMAYMERPDNPGEFDLVAWYWTQGTGPVEIFSPIINWGSVANRASRDGNAFVGMTNFFIDFGGGGSEFSDAYVWTESGGMQLLPHFFDLFRSEAFGVSADASIVVGYEADFSDFRYPVKWDMTQGGAVTQLAVPPGEQGSSIPLVVSDNGAWASGFSLMDNQGFTFREDLVRWDVATGAVTLLAQTPPGFFGAVPSAISEDGSMIVGTWNATMFFDNPEGRAFVWKQGEGARALKDILEDDYGLDLTGWRLLSARGMSDDGKTIVGHALDPDGTMTGYVAILDVSTCIADLSGSSDPNDPAYGTPDGAVDASDFFYYLDQFALGNDSVADLTGSSDPNDPSYGQPDGAIDADDFFYYLDQFVAGCP